MDIHPDIDYGECMINRVKETHPAGETMNSLLAYSRRGVWDPDKNRHLNTHAFHQIVTVSDGMLMLEDENRHQPLYENMAAFIPVGVPHILKVMRDNKIVGCSSLFIKPRIFGHDSRSTKIFKMSKLGSALLKELDKQNDVELTQGLMGECLHLFMHYLSKDLERPVTLVTLPAAKSQRCETVVRFIEENYMDELRLNDFGCSLSLSVRQLTRSFVGEMNMSIMEYLKSYRLLQSTVRLHDQKQKVIDIACDCGYNALSSFHSDFKTYFGCSPGEFRRNLKHSS